MRTNLHIKEPGERAIIAYGLSHRHQHEENEDAVIVIDHFVGDGFNCAYVAINEKKITVIYNQNGELKEFIKAL